jgi:hypothetical protein
MRGDTEKNQKNFSIEPNFFPPEINIRLYDKNSESDYLFFSSTKIRIFFLTILNKYKSGALFSIKLLLFIEKYLYYHKNDGSTSIFGMMREENSLKFKLES